MKVLITTSGIGSRLYNLTNRLDWDLHEHIYPENIINDIYKYHELGIKLPQSNNAKKYFNNLNLLDSTDTDSSESDTENESEEE